MAERSFAFEFSKAERKEANRVVSRMLLRRGKPRLLRIAMVVALLGVAVLCGFELAPFEIGRLSFDSCMSISFVSFMAAMAGVFAERFAFMIGFNRMMGPLRARLAEPRDVVLGPQGVAETTQGRRRSVDWRHVALVRRTARVLVLAAAAGDWFAVPVRLLPDADALERDIAGWRAAA